MLAELPVELLIQILGHLAVDRVDDTDLNNDTSKSVQWQNIRTLARVCRTCKQLHALATPLLYRTFLKPSTIPLWDDPEDPEQEHDHLLPQLRRFLRTLIERPDLRPHVKSLHIGGFRTTLVRPEAHRNHPCPISSKMRQKYYLTAKAYFLGARDLDWLNDLDGRTHCGYVSEDAEIALLLCLATKVSELSLQFLFPYMPGEGHLGGNPCFALAFLKTAAPSLATLRTLKLDSLGLDPLEDAPSLLEIFGIPGLVSFKAEAQLAYWGDFKSSVAVHTLRHLDLRDCDISPSAIHRLLMSCTRLEALTFERQETGDLNGHTEANPPVTWRSIIEALSGCAKYLRVLKVDLDRLPGHGGASSNSDMSSMLQHFTALETLSINEIGLFEIRMDEHVDPLTRDGMELYHELLGRLPPHLESFTIESATDLTLKCLGSAVGSIHETRPSVRQITVRFLFYATQADQLPSLSARVTPLKEAFEHHGIAWSDNQKFIKEWLDSRPLD